MNKTKKSADIVFSMLGFQYKPIEKHFIAFCNANGMKHLVTKYKKLSSGGKIATLDKHAQYLGL